jgi:5-methyltetrahydrofolate--homocysteine methyltransferase
VIIIGERLNSSRKSVYDAFQVKDKNFLIDQTVSQEAAGAQYIDFNAAALVDREIEILRWAIPLLEEKIHGSLSIDTPNVKALEEAFKICRKRPMLNSITGETKRIESLSPLVREFKPQVICLCLDDGGFPRSVAKALAIAKKMSALLQKLGLKPEDIFIDPLVRPVGVDPSAIDLCLKSLAGIKKSLPEIRTVAGISNVSFGLPLRQLMNRTLLVLALQNGLDAAICDPLDNELMAMLHAAEALLGRDPSLRNFLRFIKNQK